MLLRFGVANHRSIRDYQELLLTASAGHPSAALTTLSAVGESLVPIAALYGGNATGKSNLLDAMDDLRLLVTNSHRQGDGTTRIPRRPFRLDADSSWAPTRFDCSFTLTGENPNARGAVFDLEITFTESEILSERLTVTTPEIPNCERTLYSRVNDGRGVHVDFDRDLAGDNDVTARLTRPNSLFLSAAAQNNHPYLTAVYEWFATGWESVIADGPMPEPLAANLVAEHQHFDLVNLLLRQAEAGLGGVEFGEVELDERTTKLAKDLAVFVAEHIEADVEQDVIEGLFDTTPRRLRFLHEAAMGLTPLPYASESRGTKMFLTLLLPALEALTSGGLLVVDELDSSLHFQLAQAFLSLFQRQSSNPYGAQLIFSTHDVALLDSGQLSQDEIWIVDKNQNGVSSFTPLTDFHLAPDTKIEQAYRDGRFGGTPNLHDFQLDIRQ